jgi:peptide/nickel transport system substrate-binding protein
VKKKSIILLALVLAFTLVLAACGGNGAGNGNAGGSGKGGNADGGGQREYRNEINIAMTAQPPTLDSAMTVSQVALDVAQYIFEQLYTLDADYQPTPMLAESVEVSGDGLTYTFKLRQGVKFHNGKEMTAEDVTASMNRWLVTSSRAKVLLAGSTFETVDTYTVDLKLPQPYSDVLILIASQANFPAIMPKEIIESAPAEGVSEYIGTGPYKFNEWKQDQYIHLVRFDDYQSVDSDPSGFAGRKEAPTENVYFHFVTDHSTRISGIKTGLYDIALSIPIENYDELAAAQNLELQTFPGGTLTAFLNTREGVLGKNPKLRQAVLAALNNDEIMLASFAKPELYSLDPGYMSPVQVQWHTDAGQEYYNQNNPDKAKQLLAEAGYDGEELVLHTTKDYNEMYTGTLVIQEQLRRVGINARVENYDFPTFLELKNDRTKWDIFLASTGYQLIPPQLLAVNPDWAGLDDARVKESLANIRSATSQEEAKKEWESLQGYLYEIGSSTVLGHYNDLVAVSRSLENFELFETPVVWNARIAK